MNDEKIIPFWEKRIAQIEKESFNQMRNRVKVHTQQYIEHGFDDSDTWDLRTHMARLILPRLERYKELTVDEIVINFPLDDMILAFELEANKPSYNWTKEDEKTWQRGIIAFAEHYRALWW